VNQALPCDSVAAYQQRSCILQKHIPKALPQKAHARPASRSAEACNPEAQRQAKPRAESSMRRVFQQDLDAPRKFKNLNLIFQKLKIKT
jgi:hypothetical protein